MPNDAVHNKDAVVYEKYTCSVCKLILENVYQLPCGDRLCQECILTIARFRQSISAVIVSSATIKSSTDINNEMGVDTHESSSPTHELYREFRKCFDFLTILAQGINTQNRDLIRLSEESLRNDHLSQILSQQLNKEKLSIAENDTFLAGIAANQKILQQELSSVKQKVEDLRCVSSDGTLIWKVTNIAEKMSATRSEQQTSFYSPSFYSSPSGYKMRVRLYPNGDDSDLKMTDIDSHLQKIVDLLEPIISDRLTERLNQLQYQIFDNENRLDESERYNRSFNIRLSNVPYHKDEDAIQVTVDIANEIGCYLDYTKIETAHRTFQKPEISTSTKPPLPPVLIARFYSRPRCFRQ
ncbi:unnamed protein product [Didymodactylos carnosus]|uniref:MATH domain-containing protein n=1 Tax=Didymodactylos carnosus TaxID=1234261 RepID=A0A815F535_9BILA|nr:unnamed protein product [Didymodactylos carnosus]CAF4166303.1 unnamed protein product [Didymodactylos carnosus]